MPTSPVIAIAWPKDDYLSAIEKAGGTPWRLRPDSDVPADVADQCDGILLTGGSDVEPEHYGETDRHETVESDPARDRYEIALARLALERGVPLLAICRGIQLLNVVGGGTLVQDIPSQRPGTLRHRIDESPAEMAHDVAVAPGTGLARLLAPVLDARGRVRVNSRHHQAVKDVAPGFIVSAAASDGLVEAIERANAGFCMAVQWHPENYWRTGEFDALFSGLVNAASERRRQAGR